MSMPMPENDKRSILTLIIQDQANKRCMDCLSQAPTVACLTFGTFICTKCAEIHRELGFKVKPIGTSSFSDDELRQLSMQGNSAARLRWLARWTPAEFPEPAADDYQRSRQFIIMKYREKRWCSPSTADLFVYAESDPVSVNSPHVHPFAASSPDHHMSPAVQGREGGPKAVPPSPKLIDMYSYVPAPSNVADPRIAQLMDTPVVHMQPAMQPISTPDFMSPSVPRRAESTPPVFENQIQQTPFSEPANYEVTSPTNMTRPPPNPFDETPAPITSLSQQQANTPTFTPPQQQEAPNPFTNPAAQTAPAASNPFQEHHHPEVFRPHPFSHSPHLAGVLRAPALQKTGSLPLFNSTPHLHPMPGPSPFNTTSNISPPKPSPVLQSLSTNSTPVSSPMILPQQIPVNSAMINPQLLNTSSANTSSPLIISSNPLVAMQQQQQHQAANGTSSPLIISSNPLVAMQQQQQHQAANGTSSPLIISSNPLVAMQQQQHQAPSPIPNGTVPNPAVAALMSSAASSSPAAILSPAIIATSGPTSMNGTPNGIMSPSASSNPGASTAALSQPQDDNSKLLEEVRTLKQLFEMDMMEKEEYEARRIQLINSLTKTTHVNAPVNPAPVNEPRLNGTERAIRHRYDVKKAKWCHTATIVIMEQSPFAEGAMRKAYRMRDLSQEGTLSLMVAKIFRDPNEERASYFKDVEMQMQAKELADRFNRKNPPKKVDFVAAFVYELVDRPNKQICSAEYYIEGKFEKHNNNFGYINDDTDRNTPQAFSHFSYEDSSGQLIVVDIQGVGDNYTDPQIHTADGQGYGRGNLGAEGINKFFSTHACNQICHFLGVQAVNPKQPLADSGTKPQPQRQREQQNNDRFNFAGDVFDVMQRQRQMSNTPPIKK